MYYVQLTKRNKWCAHKSQKAIATCDETWQHELINIHGVPLFVDKKKNRFG